MKKSLSELATGWEPGKPTRTYDRVSGINSGGALWTGTRHEYGTEGLFRIIPCSYKQYFGFSLVSKSWTSTLKKYIFLYNMSENIT